MCGITCTLVEAGDLRRGAVALAEVKGDGKEALSGSWIFLVKAEMAHNPTTLGTVRVENKPVYSSVPI